MKFGKTWWGNSWIKSLKDVDFTNRLHRGKTYANTGKVYDIEIKDNEVLAKVEGRYSDYYNTSIVFEEFSNKDKEVIAQIINDSPEILASLLNHELPEKLHHELTKHNINVFPVSTDDFLSSCDCPDYAFICKHIAALVYMISYIVDNDPFEIFKLHGLDLFSLLDYRKTSSNIKSVDDLFSDESEEDSIKSDIINIDFSIIDDLHDSILFLLNDNPIFYDKNFKSVFDTLFKSISRSSKQFAENYERASVFGVFNTVVDLDGRPINHYDGDLEYYDDWLENEFQKRWHYPKQWEELKIKIDDNYELVEVNTNCDNVFNGNNAHKLYGFFVERSTSPIDVYASDIQFFDLIYQFSIELIKKHTIIPELFKIKDNYQIRWIPAVFDENISKIINQLISLCPDDCVTYNDKHLSKKDQVITLTSLFIQGFLEFYKESAITKALEKHYSNEVFRLFLGEKENFSSFDLKEYPNLINQWLNKFVLSSRNYNLYLIIEERDLSFKVDMRVSLDEKHMYSLIDLINSTEDNQLKSQLLSDMYLINEIYPEINKSFNMEELDITIDDFTNFFKNTLPLFKIMGINIILPKNLQKVFKPKLELNISTNRNETGYLTFKDITKFDWEIALGNNHISLNEFEQLAKNSEGLVKIANSYVILDETETKSLIKQIQKLPEKLNKHEILKAALSGKLDEITVNTDNQIDELIANITKQSDVKVPQNLHGKLRKYQERGFSWLVQNINIGFGSILADDMGLGKTLQVLTTILHFKNQGLLEKEKILIVMPTGLLTNWQQEIKRFTPDLSSFIYHSSKRKFPKEEYDIYLTTYGVIRKDVEKFKKKKWFLTVIDEAQNIKNSQTQQSKAIKSIKSKNRIALSGTPVENRLSEYWSIFDFINKGYLKSLKQFRKTFILPIEKNRNQEILNDFKQITQPFILRRLKNDKSIIKDLPDKITNDIYCNLTKSQVGLYSETLNLTMETLENEQGINRKGLILKLITSLKQICNHPSQYTKSKKYTTSDSGKMEVLMDLLENMLNLNEKVIIFTQYVEMGNIIKKLVEDQFNEEVLFLHGSLSTKKRDELINKFQNSKQNKIFIITIKTGGVGLNLTAASNVIHYDLWWNPAVENQATDRAYRIGQKKNVMVYRFITSGTFEEKINQMLEDKRELAELTVTNEEKFITEMDDKELKNMLKLRNS
ncbi:MAG: helicase SNF2 [Methanosphaera stadtmanae]|nr:helicase SNF2 [Methanosphaera stadtmanae]